MLNTIMIIPVLIFSYFFIFNIRKILRNFFLLPKIYKLLAFSWLLLLMGLGVWFQRDTSVVGAASADTSAMFQVLSIIFITVIVLLLIVIRNTNLYKAIPLFLLLLYALIGLISASWSSLPFVTIFKAFSLLIVTIFALLSISIMRRNKAYPHLFIDVLYFYFSLLSILALIGGSLLPELTHRPNNGVLGFMLTGWPALNSNGLSSLSAVVGVISIVKFIETKNKVHLSIFLVALDALFFAQGRTSIGSIFIAILILQYFWNELKSMKYITAIVIILMVFLYSLGSLNLEFVDKIVLYLERGTSEEQLATMSGRTELWKLAYDKFLNAPFLGHGFYVTKLNSWFGLTHPHNTIFQVLISNGILGLTIWLLYVLSSYFVIIKHILYVKSHSVSKVEYYNTIIVSLILIVQTARLITSTDLTSHHYSTMIFLSLLVYVYASKNTTSEVKE